MRFGVRSAILAAISVLPRLRLLFRPAALRVHHRRTAGILRARHFSPRSPILVGWLAGRARDQERLARESAQSDALAVRALAQAFRRRRARRHPAGGDRLRAEDARRARRRRCCCRRTAIWCSAPPGRRSTRSTPARTGAARWAFDKSEPAGWKTGTLPNVRFQFRPLVTTRGVVGVCGFEPAERDGTAFADARARAEPHPRAGGDRHRPRYPGQGFGAHRRARGEREAAHAPCSPRCRTTCARRWRRSPAR